VFQIILILATWMLEIMLSPFGSFGFLGKEKTSTFANGAFASTPSTQGLNFGKPINKKTKLKIKKKGV